MELNIVALIPARSGSKGIPNKNIKIYTDLPLFVHSINIALQCKYINDVYVSTDSEEYRNIAIQYGSNTTPIRPVEISGDLSPDIDTFKYFIDMFDNNGQKKPDIIVHLRPTYPNRNIDLMNETIETFIKNMNNYDSLRTVVPIKKTPYKMYYIEEDYKDGINLKPFLNNFKNYIEPYNQARQIFPKTFLHNGCIDIVKTSVILEKNLLSGDRIYPFIMSSDDNNDIDNLQDFINSQNKLLNK